MVRVINTDDFPHLPGPSLPGLSVVVNSAAGNFLCAAEDLSYNGCGRCFCAFALCVPSECGQLSFEFLLCDVATDERWEAGGSVIGRK